jgi:hypothetical protein
MQQAEMEAESDALGKDLEQLQQSPDISTKEKAERLKVGQLVLHLRARLFPQIFFTEPPVSNEQILRNHEYEIWFLPHLSLFSLIALQQDFIFYLKSLSESVIITEKKVWPK